MKIEVYDIGNNVTSVMNTKSGNFFPKETVFTYSTNGRILRGNKKTPGCLWTNCQVKQVERYKHNTFLKIQEEGQSYFAVIKNPIISFLYWIKHLITENLTKIMAWIGGITAIIQIIFLL